MQRHRLIVIGGSAGGVSALRELVRGLPADLPAAVLVVIHVSPESPGLLPEILSGAGSLRALFAEHGMPIKPSHIYVAPPDHHLLVEDGRLHLSRGPRENGFRPAVDPLFRTAARWHNSHVVGVVLSGSLDDGTTGLGLIKRGGGVTIVQDPAEALCPSMPASAAARVQVDHVLPVAQMPELLSRLSRAQRSEGGKTMLRPKSRKLDVAEAPESGVGSDELPGDASGFVCPECGGALWELGGGKAPSYRCHVGHSYTGDGLLAEQTRNLEAALWTALRALEDNAAINRRMERQSADRQMGPVSRSFQRRAVDAEQRAAIIRAVLLSDEPPLTPKSKQRVQAQPLPPLSKKIAERRRHTS